VSAAAPQGSTSQIRNQPGLLCTGWPVYFAVLIRNEAAGSEIGVLRRVVGILNDQVPSSGVTRLQDRAFMSNRSAGPVVM
jgi:hypothetical protein